MGESERDPERRERDRRRRAVARTVGVVIAVALLGSMVVPVISAGW